MDAVFVHDQCRIGYGIHTREPHLTDGDRQPVHPNTGFLVRTPDKLQNTKFSIVFAKVPDAAEALC